MMPLSGGEIAQIELSQQPIEAVAREVFRIQPQIMLWNQEGQKEQAFIQLRATIVDSNQTLGGTTFISSVNGFAAFSDLVLARPEQNVILRFTVDGFPTITVDSAPLHVAVSAFVHGMFRSVISLC